MLAGAGSGKTRVLVHRIAWLIEVENAGAHSILAVTFTNKAAAEMRLRIGELLGINPAGMWVGTFHGLAHRLLRAHWQEAGLGENFQILDSDDQLRLVKRVVRELGLDEEKWPPRQLQWFINGQKDEGRRPQHIQAVGDLYLATQLQVYVAYEEACRRANVVDFAELLPKAPPMTPDEIVERGEAYARATGYPIQYQWTLLDGINDTPEELDGIVRLLSGKYAIMNMIPYNTIPDLPYRRPAWEKAADIARQLHRRGILTKLRNSAGQDVDGGCGQLRARAIAGEAPIRVVKRQRN